MHLRFLQFGLAIIRLALMLALGVTALEASSAFDPLTVSLHPSPALSPLPSWAGSFAPLVTPAASGVELTVPPLAQQEEIGCFVLTTVFDDRGDGGPVVEWISPSGEHTLLSAGLGEVGVAPGPNVRTLLIPQTVALDGGKVRVSFAGRFERLLTVVLRPARELSLAALPSDLSPGLIDESGHVLSEEEISGKDRTPISGDRTDGYLVHADLGMAPIRVDLPSNGDSTEYVVPVSAPPAGCLLQADLAGLDPESWIGVDLNGENRGTLSPAPFSLNDPGVLLVKGRIALAGWRKASLYLPGRLWKPGDNSLVLTLHRGTGDAGEAVHLRQVTCDMLFPKPTPEADNTLSTGSVFGNPSPALFHAGTPSPLPLSPSNGGSATTP